MEDLLTIFLLAVLAGFLPLQFAAEISLLSTENGVRKASSLALGVMLFRVLVGILIVVFFAGATAASSGALRNVASFVRLTLRNLGQRVTSGQHVVLDGVLILAGVWLLFQAYRRVRGGPDLDQLSEDDEKKQRSLGVLAMIFFGIAWTATGPNQWLFTASGVGQILRLEANMPGRLIAFGLFLLLSSLMLMTPILIVVMRPESGSAYLEKINRIINGTLRYVITAVLFLIGAFFVWKGSVGSVHYFMNTGQTIL